MLPLFCNLLESNKLLKMALQDLLKDNGFQIPSPSAKEAHLAASDMLEWLVMTDNAVLAAPLSQEVTAALSKCYHKVARYKGRDKREKMQVSPHMNICRVQEESVQLSIGKTVSPIFFQYVMDVMFKSKIK